MIVQAFLTSILGWLIISTALGKLRNADGVELSLSVGFGNALPRSTYRRLAKASGPIELVLGGWLILGHSLVIGIVLASLLLLFFVVLSAMMWIRGESGDCGCGGLFPSEKFGLSHLLLTALLLALSLTATALTFVQSDSLPLNSLQRFSISASALLLLLVLNYGLSIRSLARTLASLDRAAFEQETM
jgi:hypothetical protein